MTKYCCTSLWKKQSIDKKVICSFWRWNIISTFGSCYNRKQVAQMHEDDIGTTLDSLPLKTPCPLVVFLVMFPKYKQNQLVNIKIYQKVLVSQKSKRKHFLLTFSFIHSLLLKIVEYVFGTPVICVSIYNVFNDELECSQTFCYLMYFTERSDNRQNTVWFFSNLS